MQYLTRILDLLFPPRDPERLVSLAAANVLGPYVDPTVHGERTVSLLPYRIPLAKACITEAKFRDSDKAQKLLASMLADYIREWNEDRTALDPTQCILVPVPLSSKRLKGRGYNQIERIARLTAAELQGIRVDTSLLSRVRDTPPQTSLGKRARLHNMHGAFVANRIPDSAYTYIVLDDVLTTGTTLTAAMTALSDAGTASIYGLALAH
jgi:predicted amidophosphoribosyltransferase